MKEIFKVNSISDYINFIKEYSEKRDEELWYRGHSNNTWKIKPNLFRDSKMRIKGNGEVQKLSYSFVDFNDELLKLKNKIIEKNLFNILGLNDFNIMFIAQHYGLLTPTLDWSIDPLVALFFAANDYKFNEDTYPVVHILKPELSNANAGIAHKDKIPITKPICIDNMNNEFFSSLTADLNDTAANHIPMAIFTNKNFSHRISKQSGKFTIHGAVGPLNYDWNSIEIKGERFVDTVKINPNVANEIKDYLRALNITKESVYIEKSELDTLCKDMKEDSLQKFKENINLTNKQLHL